MVYTRIKIFDFPNIGLTVLWQTIMCQNPLLHFDIPSDFSHRVFCVFKAVFVITFGYVSLRVGI